MERNYKDGVSICITAYNSKDFVKDAIESAAKQTWFKNRDNYEIIIGVDGDIDDLKYIQSIMGNYKNIRLLMMDSNEGTYVTSNTIMDRAKYKWLLRFDSDDIMHEDMIEILMKNNNDVDAITFLHDNKTGTKSKAIGQIFIKHEIMDKFGGYRPWTCAADTELMERIFSHIKVKHLNKSVFTRRLFSNNLTINPTTGMRSELRRRNRLFIFRNTKKENPEIKKIVNSFYEIFTNTDLSVIRLKKSGRLKHDADEVHRQSILRRTATRIMK